MSVTEKTLPALDIEGVFKSFVRDRPVLSDVDLRIERGEIHALAGANGSGKSTLAKVLSGFHHADSGVVTIGEEPLPPQFSPRDARRAGLRFVHQDKGFIAGMNVLDNMCLGRGYSTKFAGRIDWRRERRDVAGELDTHHVDVALSMDAGNLTAADKAKLAIIRALHTRPGESRSVIVLDEATAAMGEDEAAALAEWLKELVAVERLGVLFIGHRPEELREVADRVSVVRNGRIVETFEADAVSDEEIVEAIVGAPIGAFYPPKRESETRRSGGLVVEDLSGETVSGMSFDLRPGEIVGLTGIEGSGFEEVPYLLFDPERKATGRITIGEEAEDLGRASTRKRVAQGIVLVPAERVRFGLVNALTVRENISQPRLGALRRGPFQSAGFERAAAHSIIEDFGVTPPLPDGKPSMMSGGNQQKVLLGKWVAMQPKVLLLHEPTEGIDVLTKRDVFKILSDQKQRGAAILISSVEYEDLANVCDRILICGGGRVHTELGGEIEGGEVMRASYAASIAGSGKEAMDVGT